MRPSRSWEKRSAIRREQFDDYRATRSAKSQAFRASRAEHDRTFDAVTGLDEVSDDSTRAVSGEIGHRRIGRRETRCNRYSLKRSFSEANGTVFAAISVRLESFVMSASAWSFAARDVLRLEDRPVLLPGDLPRHASRNPISEQSDLHLRNPFMKRQRSLLGELTFSHLVEKLTERMRTYGIGCNQSVSRVYLIRATRELKKRWRVDHEAAHLEKLLRESSWPLAVRGCKSCSPFSPPVAPHVSPAAEN